jgi:hypothetical protein
MRTKNIKSSLISNDGGDSHLKDTIYSYFDVEEELLEDEDEESK